MPGAGTGGQFCAHVPLQFDVAGVPGAKEYSVNPRALVSTVTPPMLAVFRLPAATAAELLVPVEDWPNELHAARPAAIAATASSTSSILAWLRVSSRVCDLIIAPRPDVENWRTSDGAEIGIVMLFPVAPDQGREPGQHDRRRTGAALQACPGWPGTRRTGKAATWGLYRSENGQWDAFWNRDYTPN